MEKSHTYFIPIADIFARISIYNKTFSHYITKEYTIMNCRTKPSIDLEVIIDHNKYLFIEKQTHFHHSLRKLPSHSYLDLDFLLRAHLANRCLDFNILFIHGSSFYNNQRAYIFSGPSGSGKTTIVSKINSKQLLSDDTAIIKKSGNTFFVYASPFDKPKMLKQGFQEKKIKLENVFILKQSRINKKNHIPLRQRLQYISKNIVLSPFNDIQKIKSYRLVLALLSAAEIEELYFTKAFNPFLNL